jgi:ATP-binding cassette, subfamily C (CFTR/MRP), member 1
MESAPIFSRLIADYGGTDDGGDKQNSDAANEKEAEEASASTKPLMQDEDRNTGQIQWSIYGLYIVAAGGFTVCLFVLFLLLAEQAAQSNVKIWLLLPLTLPFSVVTTLVLGWWTAGSIKGFDNNQYIGLYTGIGGVQAMISFFNSFFFAWVWAHHPLGYY